MFTYRDENQGKLISVAQEGVKIYAIRDSRQLPNASSSGVTDERNWTLAFGKRVGDYIKMETGFIRAGNVTDDCDIHWASHGNETNPDKWLSYVPKWTRTPPALPPSPRPFARTVPYYSYDGKYSNGYEEENSYGDIRKYEILDILDKSYTSIFYQFFPWVEPTLS